MTSDAPKFAAGQDIAGAFATAQGASARSIQARHYEEHVHYHQGARPTPQTALRYNLPSLPSNYSHREDLIAPLRTRLLGDNTVVGITGPSRAVGLVGMGGIGKTTTATALAHDERLHEVFSDGVVWLSFGQGVSASAKAAELALALTGSPTSFASVDEARARLSHLTADRRLLVVLDDVWDPAATDPFTRLARDCRTLITTRDKRVLGRAMAATHEVTLPSPAEARAALAGFAQVAEADLPDLADAVIAECGHLPLALAAIGALIREGAYTWADVLSALREAALQELGTEWLPDSEQRNVGAVLTLSVNALPDAARACWLECAAFREDADIPEPVLLQLWAPHIPEERQRKRLAQEFVDRSMMRRDDARRYHIHDLQLDHLRSIAGDLKYRHLALVAAYRTLSNGSWIGGPNDGYFLQSLPWHLHHAGLQDELDDLLFNLRWIQRKADTIGIEALIADLGLASYYGGHLLEALRRSAYVAVDTRYLPAQLLGRLSPGMSSHIETMLADIRRSWTLPIVPVDAAYLSKPVDRGQPSFWDGAATSIGVFSDQRRALVRRGGGIRIVDLENGTTSGMLAQNPSGHFASSPDGELAVALYDDPTLRTCGKWQLWALFGDDAPTLLQSGGYITDVGGGERKLTMLDEARLLVEGYWVGKFILYDIRSRTRLQKFEGHTEELIALAGHASSRLVVSSSNDGSVRGWDIESGREVWRRDDDDNFVTALVIAPSGRQVYAGSSDGAISILELENGAVTARLLAHTDKIMGLAPMRAGSCLVSVSLDRSLRLWDLASRSELGALFMDDPLVSLATCPDRLTFVIGDLSGKITRFRIEPS